VSVSPAGCDPPNNTTTVSVSGLMTSISTLVSGLNHIQAEVKRAREARVLPSHDRFVDVVEVSPPTRRITYLIEHCQPFLIKERVTVDAMSKLGDVLEADLRNLLNYYGEAPDSPDSPKPEDFFALILSFSSSLQVRHRLPLNTA
jgi:diaphanous 1